MCYQGYTTGIEYVSSAWEGKTNVRAKQQNSQVLPERSCILKPTPEWVKMEELLKMFINQRRFSIIEKKQRL